MPAISWRSAAERMPLLQPVCHARLQHGRLITALVAGLHQELFELRIQGDHIELVLRTEDVLHDHARERDAHALHELVRILGVLRRFRERLGDGAQVADRDFLREERLQHFQKPGQSDRPWHQLLRQRRRLLGEKLHQFLHLVMAQGALQRDPA